MLSKRALMMLTAELVGTFVLAIIALSINRYGLPIFTAMAAGTVVATMFAAVGAISGGHFNPAVTIGFLSVRRISVLKAVAYLAAQAVGAVLAWKLYEWFTEKKIASLTTSDFDWRVFVAEMIGTAIFAFVIAAVVYRKFDGYYAAVTIGAGLFIGSSLASLVAQAGAVNPAVALALGFRPDAAGYWAYFLGPVIGAVAGMLFYKFAFTDAASGAKSLVAAPAAVATKTAPAKKKSTAKRKTSRKK